jgi:ATP-dependent exoDNAse (exonuclease V) beta subunit
MTVHQAKGLEFDVVILPELEQRLEGQRPPTWHQRTDPRDDALGLGVCQHFRKELLPLLPKLEQLERERKQAQVAESLCVLYVAVTRARHALHLVLGPEAKPEKEPGPTAGGFVRAALGCAEPLTEPEVRGLSGASGWSLAPREERAPAPELALDLALAPPRRERAPRRAPSSEEGAGRLDLAQLLRVESGVALRRGRAWHALFERVGFLEDGEPEEQDLRSALLRRGEAPSEVEALLTAFRAALRSPLVLQALSRVAFAPESDLVLLREEPFAVRVGAELWTGSFDRLVLVRRAGRVASAHVLDFKTDRLPAGDEAAFEARTRFYAPQLEGYRRAASALFALPPDAVSAALLFPFAGRLWRLEERSG